MVADVSKDQGALNCDLLIFDALRLILNHSSSVGTVIKLPGTRPGSQGSVRNTGKDLSSLCSGLVCV